MCPVVVGGAGGDAQGFGSFVEGHADKVTEFYKFSFRLVLERESVQRLIHGEQFIVIAWSRNLDAIEFHALLVAAMSRGASVAGLVNEDSPHGFCCRSEEVRAAIELRIRVADQPEPGFVDERGGLQRLVGGFTGHFRRRQFAQFAIDQRQQFIGGLWVAVLDGLKNARYVANDGNYTRLLKMARTNSG
jgi:hypothetical protein